MAMMTSAYANKMLRKLNDDKEFWRAKEEEGSIYMATIDEEPVVPEYDYSEVSKNIAEIDDRDGNFGHAHGSGSSVETVTTNFVFFIVFL